VALSDDVEVDDGLQLQGLCYFEDYSKATGTPKKQLYFVVFP